MPDLSTLICDFIDWLLDSPLPWLAVVVLGFWGAFKSDEWRRQEIKEMQEEMPHDINAWKRARRGAPAYRPPWWRRGGY